MQKSPHKTSGRNRSYECSFALCSKSMWTVEPVHISHEFTKVSKKLQLNFEQSNFRWFFRESYMILEWIIQSYVKIHCKKCVWNRWVFNVNSIFNHWNSFSNHGKRKNFSILHHLLYSIVRITVYKHFFTLNLSTPNHKTACTWLLVHATYSLFVILPCSTHTTSLGF